MDKDTLKTLMLDTAAHWEGNTFSPYGLGDGPIWDTPLIGFARGDDPMFSALREIIAPTHWTPAEAWAAAYPGDTQEGSALTVVCMAFPHDAAVMEKQQKAGDLPDIRWVYARNTWNTIVVRLYHNLIARLKKYEIAAVAPDQHPGFAIGQSERIGYFSNWSQRHIAHIAGLGTFGLSDGFITKKGIAVRLISLILKGTWPADVRPYEAYNEWCLYSRGGNCGLCVSRCPAGAVTKEGGHDKDKCKAYIARCEAYFRTLPGINPAAEMGCGLCQAGVPCARKNP